MEWYRDGTHYPNWNGLHLEIRAATSMSELNEQQRTDFMLTLLSVPAKDKRAAIEIRDRAFELAASFATQNAQQTTLDVATHALTWWLPLPHALCKFIRLSEASVQLCRTQELSDSRKTTYDSRNTIWAAGLAANLAGTALLADSAGYKVTAFKNAIRVAKFEEDRCYFADDALYETLRRLGLPVIDAKAWLYFHASNDDSSWCGALRLASCLDATTICKSECDTNTTVTRSTWSFVSMDDDSDESLCESL